MQATQADLVMYLYGISGWSLESKAAAVACAQKYKLSHILRAVPYALETFSPRQREHGLETKEIIDQAEKIAERLARADQNVLPIDKA